jgi:hypothetical protein
MGGVYSQGEVLRIDDVRSIGQIAWVITDKYQMYNAVMLYMVT